MLFGSDHSFQALNRAFIHGDGCPHCPMLTAQLIRERDKLSLSSSWSLHCCPANRSRNTAMWDVSGQRNAAMHRRVSQSRPLPRLGHRELAPGCKTRRRHSQEQVLGFAAAVQAWAYQILTLTLT